MKRSGRKVRFAPSRKYVIQNSLGGYLSKERKPTGDLERAYKFSNRETAEFVAALMNDLASTYNVGTFEVGKL